MFETAKKATNLYVEKYVKKNHATPIDFYLRPYDRNSGVEEAMQAYLSWEIDLVHEIERDGTVRFGV